MNFRLLIVAFSLVHILAYSPVTFFPPITQVDNMCHSTCVTCSQVNSRLASSCLTCSSDLLGSHYNLSSGFSYGQYYGSYDGSYDGSLRYCFDQKSNSYSRYSSLFLIIDKDTEIGKEKISLIKLYKDSLQIQAIPNETLGRWGIYNDSNILSFNALRIQQITFVLENIPLSPPSKSSIHGIMFRFYAKSSCPLNSTASTYSPLSDENFNVVRYYSLTKGQFNLIEIIYPIDFYNHTMEFSVKFGNTGCQQIINEISEVSVYLLMCDSICLRDCKSDRKQCLMCDLDEFLFGTFCVKQTTCHSTCLTCSQQASSFSCTSCYQTATETYQSLETNQVYGQCLNKPDSNIQLLMTVNGTTTSGGQYLRSFSFSQTIRSSSIIGANGYLYTNKYGQTKNDTMKIYFDSLPSHIRIYIRTKILSNCQPNSVKITLRDKSEKMIKSYQYDLASYENYIYAEFTSQQLALIIEISFTTNSNLCFLAFNDLSIYHATCQDYCGSNQCPNKPYYKHSLQNKCVSACPNGQIKSENLCVPIDLCHSTCGSCTIKNDAKQCSSCSSTFSSLIYDTLTPPGECSLIVSGEAQFMMTVSKNTILGESPLKNITYNSATYSTRGTSLSSLPSLFFLSVIDFQTLTSNAVKFDFALNKPYSKLIVRARFLTNCNSNYGYYGYTVQMILSGTPNTQKTIYLSTNVETMAEVEANQSTAAFSLMINLGQQITQCRRFLQDFSIFYDKYDYDDQNSSNSSQNQSITQSDRSLAQCLQSLSKCTTNHSLYFVIVLDFVYEEFSTSIYDSFLDQILVLVAFPAEWSRQLKLKYLKIYNLMKGSVYINGTFYYLNQSGLNTAKTRFKALSQNALSLGGFRVQSMGFVQKSPATNEVFFGNNTLIVPEPINAQNCNDFENLSSCTEQSSSSSMIIIIAAGVGGGVFIVVVAVVIYCCWKRKKTLKETDEKENDESKSDSTQQIDKKDGLRSAQNLRSNREQKVQNVGRQLRFD